MVVVGGVAIGEDFFDRENEIKEIFRLLKRDNILLIAPRRYGKTSLMREIERRIRENGYFCLFLDVMHVDKPEEFIIELAEAAVSFEDTRKKYLEALKDMFAKVKDLIEEVSVGGLRIKLKEALKDEINETNWIEKGNGIINAIKDMYDEKPVYIIIDEISECVSNMIRKEKEEDARKFLQWFRSVRQKESESLRFIVGGSVSLDKVVRGVNAPLINDFSRVYVDGFSEEIALEFIIKCLNEESIEYREEIGKKILECIGRPYIPYFIAAFLDILLQESRSLSSDLIEEFYNTKLLGVYGKGYFDYYRERLKTYYPDKLARAASEILKEACRSDEGYPKDLAFDLFRKLTGIDDYEKFMDLLSDLENDFYIELANGNVRFKSKVLRDWWRRYYG